MFFCAPYEEAPLLPIYIAHVITSFPFTHKELTYKMNSLYFKNNNINLLIIRCVLSGRKTIFIIIKSYISKSAIQYAALVAIYLFGKCGHDGLPLSGCRKEWAATQSQKRLPFYRCNSARPLGKVIDFNTREIWQY